MATEDSSGTAVQTSVRTTNAGTHKAFIVALLLRAILAGLIDLESLQGTEPPRTTWTASRRVRNRSQPRGLRGIGRKARTESKKSKSGRLAPGFACYFLRPQGYPEVGPTRRSGDIAVSA